MENTILYASAAVLALAFLVMLVKASRKSNVVSDLNGQVAALEAKLVEKGLQIANLTGVKSELEAETEANRKAIMAFELDTDKLTKQNQLLETRSASAAEQRDELFERCEKLETHIRRLTEDSASQLESVKQSAKAEIAEQVARYHSLLSERFEQEKKNLRKAVDENHSVIEALQSEIDQFDKKQQRSQTINETLRAERDHYRNEFEVMRKQAHDLVMSRVNNNPKAYKGKLKDEPEVSRGTSQSEEPLLQVV